MVSNVIITNRAQRQLEDYIAYVLLIKENPQAATSILDDALATRDILINVADSLKLCDDEELRSLGYRKISFHKHDYLYLYRVIEDTAYIEAVYHELQDYENLFKEGENTYR